MTEIDRRRRFIFRGNAAAVGGRIVHPEDVILESRVASSLTVAGGRSRDEGSKIKFGNYLSVDQAETFAEGLFPLEDHLALTLREVTADALSTTTHVRAEVNGVQVGAAKPILKIKRLRGALTGKSSITSGEPSIPVTEDTVIQGVEIDGHPLTVELSLAVFQQHDTRSKLLVAVDDPRLAADLAPHLLLTSSMHGVPVPPRGRLLQSQSTIYATVVKSIRWTKDPYPGATITDHIVKVPGFGKLLFGELLITDLSRRLTMLRLELGSPQKGDVAFAEVETNGVWA